MIHLYCYSSRRTLIVSDHPSTIIRSKYGIGFEIITSIKEKESLSIILPRILRSYNGYKVIEHYRRKQRISASEETRMKISLIKRGIPRPIESNMKTSMTMRGRSNFQGKRHSDETKSVMSSKALGNQRVAGLYWCHNPVTGVEKRVKDRNNLPPGFILGRDYDSTESMVMGMKEYWKK